MISSDSANRPWLSLYGMLKTSYERLEQLKETGGVLDDTVIQVMYRLGVAYMRRGETQNCCARNAPESCILPIQGGGIHKFQDNSKQAIVWYTKVLDRTQPTAPIAKIPIPQIPRLIHD